MTWWLGLGAALAWGTGCCWLAAISETNSAIGAVAVGIVNSAE